MSSTLTAASQHEVRHRRTPLRWHDGFPLGNGDLGVMLWGDGAPLALTLDKADLWDLRSDESYLDQPEFTYASLRRLVAQGRFSEVDEVFEQRQRRDNPVGPTKISIGRAELRLGEVDAYECALNLGTAAVEGTLRTAAGTHRVQAFMHRERNVLCLRVEPLPAEARLSLTPLAQMNEALAALGHREPILAEEDGLCTLLQSIPGGPAYAVVWNSTGPDFLLAVETGDSPEAAERRAHATRQAAAVLGFGRLWEEHTAAWESFWAESAVLLPEPSIEFLWYYGLYLLGSSARRGVPPPGLQGVWPLDGVLPPWHGDYHADMNVQETFWPACASGHLDLLDTWCDEMRRSLPKAQAFTRRFFGTEGSFWACTFLPGYTFVTCWHTVQFAWSHSGWLAWLVWLRWRHSMDRQWLEETGYPLVAEVFRFYRANLEPGEDGRLHVPLSSSPEYRENKPEAWCSDPSIDLALIRRCCDWVIEMGDALGQSDLGTSAREVRGKLVPYPLTPGKALCLWPGKPLDESHRHPSHLMAVHPAMDLTVEDGDEARAIVGASLHQYFSLGQYFWAGHSYAQLASLGAVVGRAEFAYDCLRQFAEYWIGPNGLHFNRDWRETGVTAYRGGDLPFTMEANCAVSAGISDMLLQGWRDVVRVFPAVPGHWRDVDFRDLLTEGAFRVSAARHDGRTAWVRVRAGVARRLRLRDPFAGGPFSAVGADLRREGDLLIADLDAGQEVTLVRQGEEANLERSAALVRASDCSRLGLR